MTQEQQDPTEQNPTNHHAVDESAPLAANDAAGEFTERASDRPEESPLGEDPVIDDPEDGRDASPVEEGDQDAPRTLSAEDPLRDAQFAAGEDPFPPPPIR